MPKIRRIRRRVLGLLLALMLAASAVGVVGTVNPGVVSANQLCYNTGWYHEGGWSYRDTFMYWDGSRQIFREERWYNNFNMGDRYYSCGT